MDDVEAEVVMRGSGKPVLNAYKQRLKQKNAPVNAGGDNRAILVSCTHALS